MNEIHKELYTLTQCFIPIITQQIPNGLIDKKIFTGMYIVNTY